MRTIRVAFADQCQGADPRKGTIYHMLCERYDVQISDDPEYLFYAEFGPAHLQYDCVRVFIAGENELPDFNICDYATGFAHMTYEDRYFRYPYYLRRPQACERMKAKHMAVTEELLRRDFCSFVYSNGAAMPQRDGLLELISEYRRVDSGGRHRNNIGGRPVRDKYAFEHAHKFSIACENTVHPGYTTEKLVESFAAQTVPIYFGDPRVTEVFNRDAMIVAADYPDGEALLKRIREVDADDEMYLKMLRTPALVDPEHVEKMNDGMRQFLWHIIDQKWEEAFRRDRVMRGAMYERDMKQAAEAFSHPYRMALRRLSEEPRILLYRLKRLFRRVGGGLLRRIKGQ